MKKYYGKEKCRILKQVRAEIAKNNGIDWVIKECPHKGNCAGTCPACEAEVLELEKKLEKKRKLGQKVLVAGVAAGISLTVAGCTPEPAPDTMGDVAYTGSDSVTTADAKTDPETETDGYIELMGEPTVPDSETEPVTTDPDEVLMGKISYVPTTDKESPEQDTDEEEDSSSEKEYEPLMGDVEFYPDDSLEEQ